MNQQPTNLLKAIREIIRNPKLTLDSAYGCAYYTDIHTEDDMETRPDIETILENEKKYHLEQVRRINAALAAIRGTEANNKTPRRRIKWTAKVRRIFRELPNELMFPVDVKALLRDKGFTEVDEDRYKNTVYTAMARLTEQGFLKKVEGGAYVYKIDEQDTRAGRLLKRRVNIEGQEKG